MTYKIEELTHAHRDASAAVWDFAHILRLIDAKVATGRICDRDRSRAARIAAREASEKLDAARLIKRKVFAASRGWRMAQRPFTIAELRARHDVVRDDEYHWQLPPMDHVEYYRLDRRPWRPVAIVSHEYSDFCNSVAMASREALSAELLSASWYFPEHCRAVVYTSSRDSMR